jgi:hypothetical protein
VGALTWFDEGTLWAVFNVEDIVNNVDVQEHVRAKGLWMGYAQGVRSVARKASARVSHRHSDQAGAGYQRNASRSAAVHPERGASVRRESRKVQSQMLLNYGSSGSSTGASTRAE